MALFLKAFPPPSETSMCLQFFQSLLMRRAVAGKRHGLMPQQPRLGEEMPSGGHEWQEELREPAAVAAIVSTLLAQSVSACLP